MKLRMRGIVMLGTATLLLISARAAQIDKDDPLLPPGLAPGDKFHFVFVTSPVDTIDSTWNLTQLNAHVNDIANDGGGYSGSLFARFGYTWYAIASDTNVNARDNAVVSAPVYRLDGELIATGYSDIWDGSIATNINITEKNTVKTGVVRTGSDSDGTAGIYPFGDGTDTYISRGYSEYSDSNWIAFGQEADSVRRSAYALSEEITIKNIVGTLFVFQ